MILARRPLRGTLQKSNLSVLISDKENCLKHDFTQQLSLV